MATSAKRPAADSPLKQSYYKGQRDILLIVLCLVSVSNVFYFGNGTGGFNPTAVLETQAMAPSLASAIEVTGTDSKPDSATSVPNTETIVTESKPVPAQNSTSSFDLAFKESLGFFTDIPEKVWLQKKEIAKNHPHYLKRQVYSKPKQFYQNSWYPDFVCNLQQMVGGNIDGHKIVCDPHRLAEKKPDCLVYSYGCNGNFYFEEALLKMAPNCEIHTFDPTNYGHSNVWFQNISRHYPGKIHFHPWGLEASYKDSKALSSNKRVIQGRPRGQYRTLQNVTAELGHTERRIDIFKIDIEGWEWTCFKDWLQFDLRQILVEVHETPSNTLDFFEDLHKSGYVLFNKEPNIEWSDGSCLEFSFLKLSMDFFEGDHWALQG